MKRDFSEHWNTYGLYMTTDGDSQPNPGRMPRWNIIIIIILFAQI